MASSSSKSSSTSSSSTRFSLVTAASAAAAVALLLPLLIPSLAGRVTIDTTRLVRWADSPFLNNDRCRVERSADACEDVQLHPPSGVAFLACGDPKARASWYPPAGARHLADRSEGSFRESLYTYDVRKGVTRKLRIDGLEGDFVTHGIDVFSAPDDSSKVYIFAVNHARAGDSITVFSHKLGTDSVQLVRDVKHPGIKTANGVAAVGPLQFYVTNDHYWRTGPMRYLEDKLGPFSWATHVQYCDASKEEIRCTQVTGTFPGANGITVWEDRLFVGDSRNGTVTLFRINPDHGVDFEKQIDLGAAADNLRVISTTGDLVVAIFPTLEDLPTYRANVEKLGRELLVPSGALRLPRATGYEPPELLYHDAGSVISFMTAMAVEPQSGVAIGGGVLQYGGFAVCKLSDETKKKLR